MRCISIVLYIFFTLESTLSECLKVIHNIPIVAVYNRSEYFYNSCSKVTVVPWYVNFLQQFIYFLQDKRPHCCIFLEASTYTVVVMYQYMYIIEQLLLCYVTVDTKLSPDSSKARLHVKPTKYVNSFMDYNHLSCI